MSDEYTAPYFPTQSMADQRFASYVEELRDFSRFHRIGFGHPHDLFTLGSTLKGSAAIGSEFGSLVRSIVYREHERVSDHVLLELIAAAWGDIDTSSPNFYRWLPSDELTALLHEALSQPADIPAERYAQGGQEPGPRDEVAPAEEMPIEAHHEQPSASAKPPRPHLNLYSQMANQYLTEQGLPGESSAAGEPDSSAGELEAKAPWSFEAAREMSLPEKIPSRPDPWAEDSYLHRELKLFAAARGKRWSGDKQA